ncbi:transposase, partial [Streptacidiphilus sp. EB129]|uniref:transposase n=1 Tax=Streptacidiphilus sp. EB129 TaxID=3156262 RepID=UPI003512211B
QPNQAHNGRNHTKLARNLLRHKGQSAYLKRPLRILTDRRSDLSADRTRRINRLRGQLTGIFPALERVLDMGNVGPLVLLTGYQTSAALRRVGRSRLETWLRNRKVRGADTLAQAALEAAERQHTTVPGEKIAAQVIHTLAKEVMDLNEQIAEIDKLIAARFRDHDLAEVIASMPSIGPLLGAEFLAATSGDMTRFGSADRLASFAGVAPGSVNDRNDQTSQDLRL